MKRRNLLQSMAAAPLAAAPSSGAWSNAFARQLRDDLLGHWRVEREYTMEVLEAMPEADFDFRPSPEQRTFGEQLTHLGRANAAYFAPLAKEGFSQTEPERATKETARRYVAATFDYVEQTFAALSEADFQRRDVGFGRRGQPHTTIDLFLRGYTHTAHHRGQIVTYLRVKGIKPPAWRFTPNGG